MSRKLFFKKNFVFLIFLAYIPFILKYFNSIGLMDDFIYKFGSDVFKYNYNFLLFQIERGGFQLLLPIQIWLQGLPFKFFTDTYYYLFNLLVLVLILRYAAFVVNKYIKIDYIVFYSVFFTFPYFFDYIVHPSLQEKYIFLFFFVLLHLLKLENNKVNMFLITLISLFLPYIKLQAAPLWIIIFLISLENKFEKKYLYSLIAYSVSNILILYVLFSNSGYFSNKIEDGLDVNSYTINILSQINLIIFLISIFAFIFYKKNKSKFGMSIIFFQLFLLILLNIIESQNYLSGIYAFTISIILGSLINFPNFKFFKSIFPQFMIVVMLVSNILFFIPRAERWYDLGTFIEVLKIKSFENVLIYTCSEGVNTLNKFQSNEVVFADDISDVQGKAVSFISDTYSCNNLEFILLQNCSEPTNNNNFVSRYKRLDVKDFNC